MNSSFQLGGRENRPVAQPVPGFQLDAVFAPGGRQYGVQSNFRKLQLFQLAFQDHALHGFKDWKCAGEHRRTEDNNTVFARR